MLKRLKYNDGLGEQNRYSGIGSFSDLYQQKYEITPFENFAPVNMNSMENSDMKITTSSTNVNYPFWKCFDGDDDSHANIGYFEHNTSYTVNFTFKSGKKNICFIEFKLGTEYSGDFNDEYEKHWYTYSPLKFTLYGSSDNENWTVIGSVSNAVTSYANYGNFYYHEDATTGYLFPMLGTFLFNFKNQDSYVYYKLYISSISEYYGESSLILIKRMRFFPYCMKPLHRYMLTENSYDANGWCSGTDISVDYETYFGKPCAVFGKNGDSSITISPSCTYWFNQLTVSFEVCFTDDLPAQCSIISKLEDSGWNIEVSRTDEQLKFKYQLRIGNTYYTASYDTTMSDMKDKWHLFVLTYDGTEQCLYIDGQCKSTVKCSGAINHNDSYPLNIGCETSGTTGHDSFFKGGIRELCLYYFALSKEQILKNFNNWNSQNEDR